MIEGIDYLHKKIIVHRDLKPSNIMLSDENMVKIIDFGISKLQDTFYSDYTLNLFGSKQYSSPEQLVGKNITFQSDIFSLGYIFYEIFTGNEINNRECIDVGDLPQGIQDILIKMTKEDIALRYTTISEVKRDLLYQKSLLVQEKYVYLGMTNNVVHKLYSNGYIEKDEKALAVNVLEKEYSGKCYIRTGKNKDNEFDNSFLFFGQRFVSLLKVDQRDNTRFTVTTLMFWDASSILSQKETSYEKSTIN